MKKKKDDKNMNAATIRPQFKTRKERIKASYEKAARANGKVLKRLSKN